MGIVSRQNKMDHCKESQSNDSLMERLQRVMLRFPYRPQEFFPFLSLEPGLPKGGLTEIFGNEGSGKTEAILRFLAQVKTVRAAWVEPEISIYPPALDQYGVDYRQLLFVEAKGDLLIWSVLQILRSGIFSVVVVSGGERAIRWSARQLRLLQLEAERADAAVILLHENVASSESWPIALQLHIKRKNVEWLCATSLQISSLMDAESGSSILEGASDSDLDCCVLKFKGGIAWKGLAISD